MNMFIKYNANPYHKLVGDCTVRAISKALNQNWDDTYLGIALEGYIRKDMPDGNAIWGAYLRRKGFVRHVIPHEYGDDYTVEDFAREHPTGTYILALSSHVVPVINGNYYDTWNSGEEIPIFYWEHKKDKE